MSDAWSTVVAKLIASRAVAEAHLICWQTLKPVLSQACRLDVGEDVVNDQNAGSLTGELYAIRGQPLMPHQDSDARPQGR